MEKMPFTSFDFWGYLAAGFLLMCAVDHAGSFKLLAKTDWTVVQGTLAVSVAYVLGHVNAGIASLVLERALVGKLLGRPSLTLFGQNRAPAWLKNLMSFYYAPLPTETQKAVLEKGTQLQPSITSAGEALFWIAFGRARSNDRTWARLSDFLNQFSFCRNVAMVAFIDGFILYWAHFQPSGTKTELHLAWGAWVLGIALLLRYMKFLRHYSLELFTSFAHTEEKGKTP